MNACNSRCGYCGRCDDGLREQYDGPEMHNCDRCGRVASQPVSLAGVGIACSRFCMDILARKHDSQMRPTQRRTA
jgi:hypothetical protein